MNPTKYLKGSCQQCDGHIEFPAEMAGLNTTCPHCGQPTDLLLAPPPEQPSAYRKALLWTTAAVVILGLGLAGSLVALKRAQRLVARQKQLVQAPAPEDITNTPASTGQETKPVDQSDLVGSDVTLEKTAGTSLVYAVGTVMNSAKRQRFGVKVELALLDAAGQKLGTATDYRQVLEPGVQWRFKALIVDSKAVSARLESIKEDQ
jgi:hypothetical protein